MGNGNKKNKTQFNVPQRGSSAPSMHGHVIHQREHRIEQFQGPIPPPETLEKYEKIVPGAGQTIISQFQKQVDHRHQLENKIADAQICDASQDRAEARIGQLFAFIIALAGIGGTVALGIMGQSAWPASILGGGSLGVIVTAFIYGRKKPHGDQAAPHVKQAAHQSDK